MARSNRLQSCNLGNRRGIAAETAELLHSMLVFYTFTIKCVSTGKLMHPYCGEMELWKCQRVDFEGGGGGGGGVGGEGRGGGGGLSV